MNWGHCYLLVGDPPRIRLATDLEGRAMQGFRPQRVGDRFLRSRPSYPYRGERGGVVRWGRRGQAKFKVP
jgi:hypothetical protein